MTLGTAKGLTKAYGKKIALHGVDFEVGQGRIVGLLGPNGAGKSSALPARLGLVPFEGGLRVLGLDPWRELARLICDAFFISYAAVLPGWLTVALALDYLAGVHPRCDRAK